jgi:hypothetical protein
LTVAPTAKPDLIIGNPPYSEAQDHIEAAFRRVTSTVSMSQNPGTVAMLLRVSFASGKGRVPFWHRYRRFLREMYVLAERPSFTGGATDACDYGWFVWRMAGIENGPQFCPGWSWK